VINNIFYILLGFVAAWFIQEFRLYLTVIQFKELYKKYDSWHTNVWAKLTYPNRDIVKDREIILKEEGEKEVLKDIIADFKKILFNNDTADH
jgi:hypothetical protein